MRPDERGHHEAPLGPGGFADVIDVSRETIERLQVYLDLLQRWQPTINLVGPATLADPWRRHVLDSAQLADHLPADAIRILDLGSGAGFPGLVLAIMGIGGVELVEADRRKAQFLKEAARLTETAVTIHRCRIEALVGPPADVVTARALAPLVRLLPLASRFLRADSVCLFLKGATVQHELTLAQQHWHMNHELLVSRSGSTGVVLKLWGVARARDRQS